MKNWIHFPLLPWMRLRSQKGLGVASLFLLTALHTPYNAYANCSDAVLPQIQSLPSFTAWRITPHVAQVLKQMQADTLATDSECGPAYRRLVRHIYQLCSTRLGTLLATERLETFSQELKILLEPWPQPDREWLLERSTLHIHVKTYLEKIDARLRFRFSRLSWLSRRNFEIPSVHSYQLTPMNEAWRRAISHHPDSTLSFYGGADTSSREIALDVMSLDPISLEVILFHEWMHLSDDQHVTTAQDPYATEISAWQKTLTILSLLREEQGFIPPAQIRSMILDPIARSGLRAWVQSHY